MKKYNFTLTKDNYKYFIHLYNRMMKKTGLLVHWSEYSGAKASNSVMKRYGITNWKNLSVEKTIANYWFDSIVTRNWCINPRNPNVIIQNTSHCWMDIQIGTKMYITSEMIVWKEPASSLNRANTNYIVPSSKHNKARHQNIENERMGVDFGIDMFEDFSNTSKVEDIISPASVVNSMKNSSDNDAKFFGNLVDVVSKFIK